MTPKTPRELAEELSEEIMNATGMKHCRRCVGRGAKGVLTVRLASLISQERADGDRRVREAVGEVVKSLEPYSTKYRRYLKEAKVRNDVVEMAEFSNKDNAADEMLAAARAVEERYDGNKEKTI